MKIIVYLSIVPEIVVTLLFILFIFLQLTDSIDVGYFPTVSYFVITLQVITLIVQSLLFYRYLSSVKKIATIIVLGGLVSLVLFCINEFIALSVAFN